MKSGAVKANAKMWPERRAQWCKALRSGEFEQGRGQLFDGKGHCCLGVLAQISGESYDPNDPGLARSPEVMEWVGLADSFGMYGVKALAYHNDDGKTFAEIADIIESEPEGLFVKESL